MRDIASEFKMCPPIWKAVRGRVAVINSRFGLRMPCLRTGAASRRVELCLAIQLEKTQRRETSRYWTMVKVTGFGNAVRMAFEDVLVNRDVAYQTPQRIFREQRHQHLRTIYHYYNIHALGRKETRKQDVLKVLSTLAP